MGPAADCPPSRLAKRSKAKAGTDYARADGIFNLLLREYGINIDNRAGEWDLVNKEHAFNPNVSSFVPDEDILVAIGRGGERDIRPSSEGVQVPCGHRRT